MSTTLVQIKRSNTNTAPTSLQEGELAYSYVSNTLFIGGESNNVINVASKSTLDALANASAANGDSTIVKRYPNGSIQISQADVLLAPTANSHIATKAYVDAATANAGGGAEYFAGDGLTLTSNTFAVDTTVVRTSGAQTIGGDKVFPDTITIHDLEITGNLVIDANATLINVTSLNVSDPIIYLAANNKLSDTVDIGIVGGKNDGSYTHTGLIRHASDDKWYLFDNYAPEPTNNVIDVTQASLATLRANIEANSITLVGNTVATQANLDIVYSEANNKVDKAGDTITGPVIIQATLNVSNEIYANTVDFSVYQLASNAFTSTLNIPLEIDSFSAAHYSTVKYIVQVRTVDTVQSTELFCMHDGVETYMTEYATLIAGSPVGVYSLILQGGRVKLVFTPNNPTNAIMTFKVVRYTVSY